MTASGFFKSLPSFAKTLLKETPTEMVMPISFFTRSRIRFAMVSPSPKSFKLPVSAMAGIAVFAISMTLIVSGSVLVGTSEGEVGKLDSQIASLKAEKADIEGKLDLKYTVDQIEADAKAMGMIKRQYADNEYITLKEDDEIVIYDDGKEENLGLSALLSAFGINPED